MRRFQVLYIRKLWDNDYMAGVVTYEGHIATMTMTWNIKFIDSTVMVEAKYIEGHCCYYGKELKFLGLLVGDEINDINGELKKQIEGYLAAEDKK